MSGIAHCRTLGLLLVASVGLSCSDPVTSPERAPQTARSAPVLSNAPVSPGWQAQARLLVAANNLNAYAAGRVYAVLSVAQYRAVVESDGHFDVEGVLPEHGLGTGGRSLLESRRGAVAGASAEVLAFFFPAAAATLEGQVATEAGAGPGNVHPRYTRGLEIGRSVGDALVERARSDHFTTPWAGTVPTGPGLWFGAPLGSAPAGAVLVGTTPYLLTSADQFRLDVPPPPAFGSAEFQAAVNEVRRFSDTRTAEQTTLARDWNYGGGTFTPPGYWNLVAATYVRSYRLDERAATHVFALMHAAMADAQIACWDVKMLYWTMRPSQVDPRITLVFALPNHPSYPSGHSCLSGAGATVLSYFFPDRATELADWVTMAGLSRIYAGIHYRFDVVAGQQLGGLVGNWAIEVDQSLGLLDALR